MQFSNGSNQEQKFIEYVIYSGKSIWIQCYDFELEYKVEFEMRVVLLCLLEAKIKSIGKAETSLESAERWVLACRGTGCFSPQMLFPHFWGFVSIFNLSKTDSCLDFLSSSSYVAFMFM